MDIDLDIDSMDLDEVLPENLVLFDDDGYPTDEALEVIRSFYGTPRQLVAYIKRLWRYAEALSVEKCTDDDRFPRDHPEVEISFATVGWSGNENIISSLDDTMFSFMHWYLSKRGGLYVYRVSEERWDTPMFLGNYVKWREFSGETE
jgi:hypothetical protein